MSSTGRRRDEVEDLYRSLVESAPVGILAFDRKGRSQMANQRLVEMLGSPSLEATLEIDALRFPPLVEAGISQLVLRCIEAGESGTADSEYISKWGRKRYLRFHITPVRDADGELVGGQATVEDLTEVNQIAEDLAARSEFGQLVAAISTDLVNRRPEELPPAIQETLGRIGRFMAVDRVRLSEFSDDLRSSRMTYLWDSSGEELASLSEEFKALSEKTLPWGFDRIRHLLPVLVSDVDKLPPEAATDREFWKRAGVTAVLSLPLALGGKAIGEFGFFAKDGPRAWSDDEVSMLRMVLQLLSNAILRVRSDRERWQLEDQLRQAQKMEAVGVLAGGIAHDFNNLLTAILGGVDMALFDLAPDSEISGNLQRVQEAAERATELTRQLLTLSRKSPAKMGSVDVSDVLARTVQLLRRSIPGSIEVALLLDGSIPTIRGDAGQLGQALLNLGINARDAMPDGGSLRFGAEVVDLDAGEDGVPSSSRVGRFAVLSVSDSGCGMPGNLMSRIFEPFFTTKEPGKGTGLGLAMVYNCVNAHDGWIDVDSEEGKGSEFRIHLPLLPVDAAPVLHRRPHLPGGDETILLVDDEDAVLFIARRMLERCGYRVLIARNGEEALREFDASPGAIDAVVTDLVMPRGGGRGLLSALRKRGATLPVLLTSGHATAENPDEFLREGFAALVTKPYQIAALAQAVRRILDGESAAAEV